jgi:hypothetical protein
LFAEYSKKIIGSTDPMVISNSQKDWLKGPFNNNMTDWELAGFKAHSYMISYKEKPYA